MSTFKGRPKVPHTFAKKTMSCLQYTEKNEEIPEETDIITKKKLNKENI